MFLHEVSKVCNKCERDMCMFRYPIKDNIETKNDEKNTSTFDQSEILDEDEIDEITDHENKISNRTFRNPSQVDNYSSDELLKCEICDFASGRQEIKENHKKLIHNWCAQRFSRFVSQNKLNCHVKTLHCDK